MLYIENKSLDPHFNLALEEYVIRHLDLGQNVFMLWQNEPSVIIGRNQNTIEEINAKYIKENQINVVRRLSGGGAVYHDSGNLNFTFIMQDQKDEVNNFRKFTDPVIKVLQSLGIPAEFSGRNDITIEGKKFSGNAQYACNNRLLHHGTILYNSDLSVVQNALNVRIDKIESKGIKSVRSRVTNVAPYLKKPLSIDAFKDILVQSILETNDVSTMTYQLTEQDLEKIQEIMEKRYLTWEWNYGESPAFDMQKIRKYEGGLLDLRVQADNGKITGLRIFGDFFGKYEVSELEQSLTHIQYTEEAVRNLLESVELQKYMHNITVEDFIDCLFY
ncbi:lipoate-protein ligase [Geosporobacter subterraneus DSM 17957]|uniref:lipoate--protein ligase n=1 Tax=Geosporobacter subterraneus DSM 17957 TaxID=1121919 RepID=A0A1M6NBB0_9FIRM|nr:lipoate--protein ligase [Geosporobacter subterraneus]SHJ92963.1 lipoate-protein ligase [Geosporobacter subterraneus DSM 17957]